ncbi:hypothetical protein IVB12_15655 [Bradyrhizobium sp. 179]|uniref:hypothetical protein n=1 Tax=Bradyrhizobium sp. 179 TaxID=2782648 RepID=UPI001FFBD9FE|nr:hypothetical protein [Bradyrhizobium sp. 179]MCK1543351.1 hypothetical protein [Bradyrhizobium sp. 179]
MLPDPLPEKINESDRNAMRVAGFLVAIFCVIAATIIVTDAVRGSKPACWQGMEIGSDRRC